MPGHPPQFGAHPLVQYFPALLLLGQEFAFGQDAQMFGYGLAGDVEVLRNGVGGQCLHGDQDEDRSSGGIRNGLKNIASHTC
jgi:hypothetical protein